MNSGDWLPVDAVAGTKHVIGIVFLNLDAKDNTDTVVLGFPNQEQVSKQRLSQSLCGCLNTPTPVHCLC